MPRDPAQWVVDDLREADHPAWARLHRGYLDFYESTRPEEVSAVVWGWLMDPAHELAAIVARPEVDAEPVGIAHYRPFVRPLQGSTACFLDDLSSPRSTVAPQSSTPCWPHCRPARANAAGARSGGSPAHPTNEPARPTTGSLW